MAINRASQNWPETIEIKLPRCPECGCGELFVIASLSVKVHADGSWDVETPFMYSDDDETNCRDCDWEGTYGDCTY